MIVSIFLVMLMRPSFPFFLEEIGKVKSILSWKWNEPGFLLILYLFIYAKLMINTKPEIRN